jgi:hypothetical protein
MNENHTHDKALLQQIERRLTRGQPTGDPLLDDLAGTVPRADAGFRAELEQRLLAQLDATKRGTREDETEMTTDTLTIDFASRRGRPSMTMAAAVLAVLVIVGLLVIQARFPAGPEPSAAGIAGIDQDDATPTLDELLQATAVIITATTIAAEQEDTLIPAISGPLVPVVITLREILPGQPVDENALAVTWWPPEIIPAGVYNDPRAVDALYAADHIAPYQPLLESRLAESPEAIGRTILLTPTVFPPTVTALTPTVIPPTVVPPEPLPLQATPTVPPPPTAPPTMTPVPTAEEVRMAPPAYQMLARLLVDELR